jgi:hypothetical protein
MTILQKFFARVNGKPIKFWASTVKDSFECTDLAAVYNEEVVGGARVSDGHGALDWWPNAPRASYTPIENTPSFVPKAGDLAVWGPKIGKWGHIGICSGEGNTEYFVSMDQNWGGQTAHFVRHDYYGILGFLRPKKDVNFDQDAYDAAQVALANAKALADAKAKADALAKLKAEADAKAKADALAKAEAKRIADEQAKLAAEQAKIIADTKAKQEADAKALADKLKAEETAKKEKAMEGSQKFDLNLNDLKKAAIGSLYTFLGSLSVLMLPLADSIKAGNVNLSVFGLAVAAAMVSALANLIKRFVTDETK